MNTTLRYAVLSALFLILLIPLYVSSQLFFPFITGKNFAFRILVEIATVGYVLLAIADRRYRPRFSWVLAFFGLLVGWMAIANAFGVYPLKAFWSNFERMDGWVTLIHLLAFFLVAGTVLTVEKLWKKWWLTFIAVSAVICGYGLLQLSGSAEIHQGGVRADASFGNAIYLAVYLMFAFFVTGWQALEAKKGSLRYWLIALMAVQLVVLVAASSRGAVIGLAGGIGLGSVLWLFETRKEWKKTRGARVAAGVLASLVLLVGGFFLIRDSSFVANEPALARLSTVFDLGTELKVRGTIWGMALEGVAERPVIGYGQEGFNQVFNTYYEPSLYGQEAWFDRAHNMYIDWLVAGGIPALLLFFLLLLSAFIALYRNREMSRVERVLLIAALGAYAIQAIVVFDNLWSYIPLAAILAMAHAASARKIPALERLPEARGEQASAILLPVGIAAAILLVWTVNVPGIRAAHHLVYALSPAQGGPQANIELFKQALGDGSFGSQEIREQLVIYTAALANDKNVPADFRASATALAIEEMGTQIEDSPADARLRVQYAVAFESAGRYEEAVEQADAALALSPQKQALFIKRGLALWKLGRLEEAKAAFRQAYELDRSFTDVAVSAAVAQIASGDVEGGKELLQEAVGTTTLDSDAVFYAYYQAKAYPDLIRVAQIRVTATAGAPDARYRLAQAYAVAGRVEEARREVTLTMAAHPSTKATGEALMKQISALNK